MPEFEHVRGWARGVKCRRCGTEQPMWKITFGGEAPAPKSYVCDVDVETQCVSCHARIEVTLACELERVERPDDP